MALRHPRAARLLRPADFAALRDRSRRLSARHFVAQYRPTHDGGARLGMAVSRKVSKHAVVRNRIRRQIRETFRLSRARFPDGDVLVIARPSAAAQTSMALRMDLELLWNHLIASAPIATLNETRPTGTMRAS